MVVVRISSPPRRPSKRRVKSKPDEREVEVMEALASITKHPSFTVLREEVTEARQRYFENLAAGLATRREPPVDQREIDEKRGFWLGATWALTLFPTLKSRQYDEFVAEALKESEELGGS